MSKLRTICKPVSIIAINSFKKLTVLEGGFNHFKNYDTRFYSSFIPVAE